MDEQGHLDSEFLGLGSQISKSVSEKAIIILGMEIMNNGHCAE